MRHHFLNSVQSADDGLALVRRNRHRRGGTGSSEHGSDLAVEVECCAAGTLAVLAGRFQDGVVNLVGDLLKRPRSGGEKELLRVGAADVPTDALHFRDLLRQVLAVSLQGPFNLREQERSQVRGDD